MALRPIFVSPGARREMNRRFTNACTRQTERSGGAEVVTALYNSYTTYKPAYTEGPPVQKFTLLLGFPLCELDQGAQPPDTPVAIARLAPFGCDSGSGSWLLS